MTLTQALSKRSVPVLVAKILRLQVAQALRALTQSFATKKRPPTLTLDDLCVPDSHLTRTATALVTQLEPPMLLNHSVRTYLFGAAIGRHLGLRVDLELLYLGAILHDVGLVAPYDTDGSFEINGARAAREFMLERGVAVQRADLVHEAIALHTSVGLVESREPEIKLVQYGAGMDVVGLHYKRIAPETREVILAHYPRHDFKRQFSRALESQAHRKPDCHIAGYLAAGFARRIHDAPYSE